MGTKGKLFTLHKASLKSFDMNKVIPKRRIERICNLMLFVSIFALVTNNFKTDNAQYTLTVSHFSINRDLNLRSNR